MVARGQLDDATLYMCSKFPLCPTITRVQRTIQVQPAAPPKPKPKRKREKPAVARKVERKAEPAVVVAEPVAPAVMLPMGMLVRNRLVGSPAEIRRAIVLSEILSQPLATREHSSATMF